MKKNFKNKKLIIISLIIGLNVFLLKTKSYAGPNELAGCAVDMDISTRDYDSIISDKDIENNIEAGVGDEIWVGIIAQNVTNLDTYTVEVSFDPNRLQYIQGAEENLFGGIKNILKENNGNTIGFQLGLKDLNLKDNVVIANALAHSDKEEAPEGTGFMALLQFKLLDNKPNNFIRLQEVIYVDSDTIVDSISKISKGIINGRDNSPPAISNISDQTICKNSTTDEIFFTINDVETFAEDLQLIGKSSNQTLIPNSNIVFGGSSSNRSVTISPANDQSGNATIEIIVKNHDNLTSSTNFSFIVYENTDPVISEISDIVIAKNSSTGDINFSVNDKETNTSQLNITATSNNQLLLPDQNIRLGSISNTDRTMFVVPVNNQTGTAVITIQVTDECYASINETFDVIVNSPPEISSISDQTTKENTPIEILFLVNDQETSLDELKISTNSNDENIVPNKNMIITGTGSNRSISITPNENKTGMVNITITVADEYKESSSTNFKLFISKQLLKPTISGISDQTICKSSTTNEIFFTIDDAETSAENLHLIGKSSNQTCIPNSNILFGGSASNRSVTISPANNQSGNSTIEIIVKDSDNLTSSASFQLSVEDNTPPIINPSEFFDQNILKNKSLSVNFTIFDEQTLSKNLIVKVTSSNQILVHEDNIDINCSDEKCSITIIPVEDIIGTANITFEIIDECGMATDASFNLSVTESDYISGTVSMLEGSIPAKEKVIIYMQYNELESPKTLILNDNNQFLINIEKPNSLSKYTLIASIPGYYINNSISGTLPITNVNLIMEPLISNNNSVIIPKSGGASFYIKDKYGDVINNAKIDIPLEGIFTSSPSVAFSYTAWDNQDSIYTSGSGEILVEVNIDDDNVIRTNSGINITIPIKESITLSDLTNGIYNIYHALNVDDLLNGKNLTKIDADNLIEWKTGEVTFSVTSLSIFGVGHQDYSDPPNPIVNNEDAEEGGGCFIKTISLF